MNAIPPTAGTRSAENRLLDLITERSSSWQELIQFGSQPSVLRGLLADLSLDQATFVGKYGLTRKLLIESLKERQSNLPSEAGTAKNICNLVLLFARAIEISERLSDEETTNPESSDSEIRELNIIVKSSGAREIAALIRSVYDFSPSPSIAEQGTNEGSVHLQIDWVTIELHTLGTSSLIFKVRRFDRPEHLVLKIWHIFYTLAGPIREANSSYAKKWRRINASSVVNVYASGPGWLIEDFIEGKTVRDLLQGEWFEGSKEKALISANIFDAILVAVGKLHDTVMGEDSPYSQPVHGDLNPSNMIVLGPPSTPREDDKYTVKLIDMGRNLLASDIFGLVRSIDTKYVAPEVRRMEPQESRLQISADYYSLGHILAFCFGHQKADGFYLLDESFFVEVPELARIAARLIDDDPNYRVQYVKVLRSDFERDANRDAASREQAGLAGLGSHVQGLAKLLHRINPPWQKPLILEFSVVNAARGGGVTSLLLQQAKLLWDPYYRDRTLRGMERVCAARIVAGGISWICTILLVLMSIEQVHVPLFRPLYYLLGRARYQGWEENAQIWIVGLSFGYLATEFGHRASSGISFWKTVVDRKTRIASEIFLWWLAVCTLPLVTLTFFLGYQAWPWTASVGYLSVALNFFVTRRARSQIEQRLSPSADKRRRDVSGKVVASGVTWFAQSRIGREQKDMRINSELLQGWVIGMSGIAIVVLGVSVLLTTHWIHGVHDYLTDAILVAFLNIPILGWGQVIRQGKIVKSNLSQYCVAGEILRAKRERSLTR